MDEWCFEVELEGIIYRFEGTKFEDVRDFLDMNADEVEEKKGEVVK